MRLAPRTSPSGPRTRPLGPVIAALLVLTTSACRDTFYPLKNRVTPGLDAFVVFVGDGQNGASELFAGQAGGGNVFQVTFTLAEEDAPALSPSGGVLAFTRAPSAADSSGRRIWFMNLVTGAERDVPAFPGGAVPLALAFSADGAVLYARTTAGLWAVDAPPAALVPRKLAGADSVRADSALTTFIGEPPFARIAACEQAVATLCAFVPGRAETPLQAGATDPVHWGADSVAYMVGSSLLVRSGAGGRAREVMWARVPPHPRKPTYAPAASPPAGAR
ncbi:MAG TPA: hypothetical protein VFS07_05775 [Gemmatimonadales bacterium]|nr:hypothetical protein [Gemmatimonadales bacterium]